MKLCRGIIFGVIVAVLVTTSCASRPEFEHPRSAEVYTIWEKLDKTHPDLYNTTPKKELLLARDRLIQEAPHLSDAEFFYSLQEFIALAGDSHTGVAFGNAEQDRYTAKYSKLTALPFGIVPFQGRWHIALLREEQKEYLGARLLNINNTSIDEVFELSKRIIPADSDVWVTTQFSNTINFLEALEYLGIATQEENLTLTVELLDGEVAVIPIEPISKEELANFKRADLGREHTPATWPNSAYYTAQSLEKDTLFIQYNSCAENPEFPMVEFASSIEKRLKNSLYSSVILDLRYNSGGNSQVITPLIDTLARIQKSQELAVYTLIGQYTFSSAILNAAETAKRLNSTLVGTPTGGSGNHYGELSFFEGETLPITIYCSTKVFKPIRGVPLGEPIQPDVYIEQRYSDYVKGIDPEVQWILSQTP